MTLPALWSRLHTHTPDVRLVSHTSGCTCYTFSPSCISFSHHVTPSRPLSSFFHPFSEGLPSHLFTPAVTSCVSLFTISAFYSPHSLSILLLCRTTSHSISEDFQSKQYQFNSIRKWSTRTWTLLELPLCDCVFVCTYVYTVNRVPMQKKQKHLHLDSPRIWKLTTTSNAKRCCTILNQSTNCLYLK